MESQKQAGHHCKERGAKIGPCAVVGVEEAKARRDDQRDRTQDQRQLETSHWR
jgi:hypothetical protein